MNQLASESFKSTSLLLKKDLWFVLSGLTDIVISFFFKSKQMEVLELLPGKDSRQAPMTVNFEDLMK